MFSRRTNSAAINGLVDRSVRGWRAAIGEESKMEGYWLSRPARILSVSRKVSRWVGTPPWGGPEIGWKHPVWARSGAEDNLVCPPAATCGAEYIMHRIPICTRLCTVLCKVLGDTLGAGMSFRQFCPVRLCCGKAGSELCPRSGLVVVGV